MRPISKRAARIAGITVGLFAVAGALLWLLLDDGGSQGPLIWGKPVEYWTRQFDPFPRDPNAIDALASEKAVAIPALVRQLSLPDSRVKDVAKGFWRRLPAMLRVGVAEPTTRAELRAGAAFALDSIYQGPGDRSLGPSLSEAQMMLPALTRALQDRDVRVRYFAAYALGSLEVISAQAIEACEVALRDPHWSVRNSAVASLSSLSRSDKRAIPPMKSALTDSHPNVRKQAWELWELLAQRRYDAPSTTEAK